MIPQQNDISNGVNLLISILVRYPEIGTIRFNPANNTLEMTFMLSQLPTEEDNVKIKKLIDDSLQTYHILQKTRLECINIKMDSFDEMAILTLVRDVNTFSKSELELAIILIRNKFTNTLIVDINDFMQEDFSVQDDLIDHMLQTITNQEGKKLIGIREDGRVLVFNK